MASVIVPINLPLGIAPYLRSINYENPYTTIVAFCKSRTYLLQSTNMMYRWYLVAACIDRCALTSTNARLRKFANIHIAYRVIGLIIIIWLILPIHIIIFFDLNRGRCFPLNNITVSLYHSIYTIISGNILPVSIMIVCAIIIRHNLVVKHQHRLQLTTNVHGSNQRLERKRDQQVFLMLLLQVFVYIITQTPWMLFNIYTTATIYVLNKSKDRLVIEEFISFMSDMFVFFLPVLSFYLYTLASRKFRSELMKLLHYSTRCRQLIEMNRITPLANNVTII